MRHPAEPRHAAAPRPRARRLGPPALAAVLVLSGAGAVAADRLDREARPVSEVATERATPREVVTEATDPAGPRVAPRQQVQPGARLEKAPPPPEPSPPSLAGRAEDQASRSRPEEPVEVTREAGFTIGTLNVLGSNHTPPGSGWAPGRTRIGWAADVILARGIEVVGLQEMQDDQIPVLASRLAGYTVWPQQALGPSGNRLQIAYRSDLFEMVDAGSISTVFSSQMRPVPWVRLRDRESGLSFHVVTLHNSPRGLEGERDNATGTEIALFNQLLGTGLPLLVTGDTNEPAEFFCRVGAATGMVAANGGSTSGGCVLPPAPTGLDWVMGGNVTGFTGYARTPLPKITDHPIVYSNVALQGTVTD